MFISTDLHTFEAAIKGHRVHKEMIVMMGEAGQSWRYYKTFILSTCVYISEETEIFICKASRQQRRRKRYMLQILNTTIQERNMLGRKLFM